MGDKKGEDHCSGDSGSVMRVDRGGSLIWK